MPPARRVAFLPSHTPGCSLGVSGHELIAMPLYFQKMQVNASVIQHGQILLQARLEKQAVQSIHSASDAGQLGYPIFLAKKLLKDRF